MQEPEPYNPSLNQEICDPQPSQLSMNTTSEVSYILFQIFPHNETYYSYQNHVKSKPKLYCKRVAVNLHAQLVSV